MASFLRVLPAGRLRTYLLILLIFTLGNSSDVFLLLRAGQLGVTEARIPLLWTFFNLVKMCATMPFGALSDRIGRRGVIISGWGVYALAYIGFAFARTELHIWLIVRFLWALLRTDRRGGKGPAGGYRRPCRAGCGIRLV